MNYEEKAKIKLNKWVNLKSAIEKAVAKPEVEVEEIAILLITILPQSELENFITQMLDLSQGKYGREVIR